MSGGKEVSREAGRELDAEVAEKVFGLRHLVGAAVPYVERHHDAPEDEQEVWVSGERPAKVRFCRQCGSLPPYSTDIAAAFSIADKFEGQHFGVEHAFALDGTVCGWIANVAVRMAVADTVPLAICRAALAAVASRGTASPELPS